MYKMLFSEYTNYYVYYVYYVYIRRILRLQILKALFKTHTPSCTPPVMCEMTLLNGIGDLIGRPCWTSTGHILRGAQSRDCLVALG